MVIALFQILTRWFTATTDSIKQPRPPSAGMEEEVMTRKRSARCVVCYEAAWKKYGTRTTYSGDPLVYSYKGTWEHVRVIKGPRGGYKAECKNCGHIWRISSKTASSTVGIL